MPAEITDIRLCVAFTLCKRLVNITGELLLKVTHIVQDHYLPASQRARQDVLLGNVAPLSYWGQDRG